MLTPFYTDKNVLYILGIFIILILFIFYIGSSGKKGKDKNGPRGGGIDPKRIAESIKGKKQATPNPVPKQFRLETLENS